MLLGIKALPKDRVDLVKNNTVKKRPKHRKPLKSARKDIFKLDYDAHLNFIITEDRFTVTDFKGASVDINLRGLDKYEKWTWERYLKNVLAFKYFK